MTETAFFAYVAAKDGATTAQYNVVLKNLGVLTERLQHAKQIKTLLSKFKMEKWIASGAKARANELVELALNRIKTQVTDYDMFITMLKSMPGVKSIADQMTGIFMYATPTLCVYCKLHWLREVKAKPSLLINKKAQLPVAILNTNHDNSPGTYK